MTREINTEKPDGRFISPTECAEIYKRAQALSNGLGNTAIAVNGSWTGNIRWGRNEIISCGDVRRNIITVLRNINGAQAISGASDYSHKSLAWAIAKAERFLQFKPESASASFPEQGLEPYKEPRLWFDATFNLLPEERATIVNSLIEPAESEGMLAAGYIQVSGSGRSIRVPDAEPIFIRYTEAQLSVTVRDPKGLGSGWAGVDWNDWKKIDGNRLTAVALEKCLKSRNPSAVEPGRYNVVLEPQAAHDIVSPCFDRRTLMRFWAEGDRKDSPYAGTAQRTSKIGLRIFDERISVALDPMNENCSFVPVFDFGTVYNRAVWIENGFLKNLSYDRRYAIRRLGLNSGLPSNSSYSMSGGEMSVYEMIERTERGLLVTRFSHLEIVDNRSLLFTGYTRDGLWLIERGKISKPVKNMRFTESPFHTLNNVVELGIPQRVFSPGSPAVVPAIMSRDFSFTATVDAI